MELGFLIPMVSGIEDALSLIPDPKAQDSRVHKDSGIRIVSHGASVILSRFFCIMVSSHVTCSIQRMPKYVLQYFNLHIWQWQIFSALRINSCFQNVV